MSRDARYPNVTVYAEAAPELEDASSENARKLTETFRTILDKELAPQGLKLEEPVHAIQIGDFFGVEYVRRAKIGADSVERLFLVTVQNGRKYTLELRGPARLAAAVQAVWPGDCGQHGIRSRRTSRRRDDGPLTPKLPPPLPSFFRRRRARQDGGEWFA